MSELPTAPALPEVPPAPGGAPAEAGVWARGGADPSDVRAGRGLGIALAVAAADPALLAQASAVRGVVIWVLFFGALAAVAWFAAPPVVARPVIGDVLWRSRLSRHRNTGLALGFVVVAALTGPTVWLMACDAALLLAYLLFVDATAGGPPGAAQLRDWPTLVGAFAAQALVLTGAVVSIPTADPWARGLAAGLVLAVAGALAATLRRR